ncbi:MAG: hypothetical protein IT462_00380 [Planctomycetes bacterium]|nr:hypothetical protein [Planctomycetota bacterium]
MLNSIPGWKVFSTGIGIAGLGIVAFFLWSWFLKAPDDLKPLEREAYEDALNRLAGRYEEEVRKRGQLRVVLMPVQDETSHGEKRERAFGRLNATPGLKVIKPPDPDLESRAITIFKGVIGNKEEPVEPAKVFDRAAEADEVLTLQAPVKAGADSGRCDLIAVRIVRDSEDRKKATVAEPWNIEGLSGAARVASTPAATGPGFWSNAWDVTWRVLVMLSALVVIAFAGLPVARLIFRLDSNLVNGVYLGVLTLGDIAVLLALCGFQFAWWIIALAVVVMLAGGFINLRVLNAMEENL